ncbi:MAG TPA: hypothetical protein VHW24_08030 [Bryobacteraceae bacterium]|jgi:hypothetical protein|nr:hypothetical protein [Bryobacteraceae bacterium]
MSYALQCAADIANTLSEMHEQGRMHGAVGADSILLTATGAELVAPRGRPRYAEMAAEVAAFGSVLFEMMAGSRLTTGVDSPAAAAKARTGEDTIHAAVSRLASKCIRTTSNTRDEMQRVWTDLRYLALQAKVFEMEAQPAARPAPPQAYASPPKPTPPVTPPPQTGNAAASTVGPRRRVIASTSTVFTPLEAKGFLATDPADSNDPIPSGVRCPKCGLPYVYPSRPRSWLETLLAAWNSPPMRCHRCLHRFVTILGRFHFEKGSPMPSKHAPF